MTIRRAELRDAAAVARIYNHYVTDTVISFETEPVSEETMRRRIADISARYPYFVCETEAGIAGYCYAHAWKERAAYRHTLETTVYLAPEHTGRGLGRMLMERLVEECRREGYHALVACVTTGNAASDALHRSLGFRAVSRFEAVGRKFGRWLDVTDYELLLGPQ